MENNVDWKAVISHCQKKCRIYSEYKLEMALSFDNNKIKEILDDVKDDYQFINEIKEKNVPVPVLQELSNLERIVDSCVTFGGNLLLINQFLK